MKIAIIGRTEILYDSALLLVERGHSIVCVLTAKDAPEYTRSLEDFARLARELGASFASGARISEWYPFLKDAQADIGVSMNYPGIVPQGVIDLFPLGILNAHGGDLPRYRGNACQSWAILNGESRLGLCIHRMIGGELDSGDILARSYKSITENTKVTEAWSWMHAVTPALMAEAVDQLSRDPSFVLERQAKEPSSTLRCYPRRPEDGRISWAQTALEVLRLVNASNRPYAGAFCSFKGKRVIIWDAERAQHDAPICAVPGQVLRVGKEWVDVACAQGFLRVHSVEIDGKVLAPAAIVSSIRERFQ